MRCYDCQRACPSPLSYHPDVNLIPLLETGEVRLTVMGQEAEMISNVLLVAMEKGIVPSVRVLLLLYYLQPSKVEFSYSSPVRQLLSCHLNLIRNCLVFCVSIKCHMFVLQLFVSFHEQNWAVVNQIFGFFSQSCCLKSIKPQYFCSALGKRNINHRGLYSFGFAFNFRPSSFFKWRYALKWTSDWQ